MTRRLLLGYLSATLFVLVLLGLPLAVLYARHERSRLIESVRLQATETAAFAALPLATGEVPRLTGVVADYGRETEGRLLVVSADGRSVADSAAAPGRSFADRPEVTAALRGHESHGFRRSESLQSTLFFVAVPVNSGGTVLGAVRITYPATYVEARIHRSWALLAVVSLGTLAAVAGLSLILARSVADPVRELELAAGALGDGDLASRAPVPAGPPELRHLARAFNVTAAKLERAVGAQQEFVADASHQLRTPLAALRLRLENLEARTEGPAADDLTGALDEVHRLSRIVDGLLVLARADATGPQPTDVDVDAIAAARVSSWRPFADEAGVALALVGHAGMGHLTPDGLEQVLDNILANAIEATPAGGDVTVRLHRTDDDVHVHVVDQGPGMSESERRGATTRFLGGRPRSAAGGFGLGLAIAHRLVTRDGGELELTPGDGGRGLAVKIRLPAAPAS